MIADDWKAVEHFFRAGPNPTYTAPTIGCGIWLHLCSDSSPPPS